MSISPIGSATQHAPVDAIADKKPPVADTTAPKAQAVANTPAVTINLSSAKTASTTSPSATQVNADGTIGPHHKARHPKLPGSFHV